MYISRQNLTGNPSLLQKLKKLLKNAAEEQQAALNKLDGEAKNEAKVRERTIHIIILSPMTLSTRSTALYSLVNLT